MVTIKDINGNSSWAKKLHSVAKKYGVDIIAENKECSFFLRVIDDKHTEDDSIVYKFNSIDEVFEFKYIYQMDNLKEKDLPKTLEYQSDFFEVVRAINKAEIKI